MKKLKFCLLALLSLTLLSGCGLTLGPKVEDHVVFVRTLDKDGNPIKAGRISESRKVEVEFTTESGRKVRQKIDVGGFYIVPPSNQE